MVALVTRDRGSQQTLHIFPPLICTGLLEALDFRSVIGTLALSDGDLGFATPVTAPVCLIFFRSILDIREFKQITTAGATTAAVTEKVWGEYVSVVC